MKGKNVIYAVCAALLCASVVIFGELCLNAAVSGFELWLCCVMPSVFPFFVCVSLLRASGLIAGAGSPLALYLGCAASGAPAGSRLCAQLADKGIIPPSSVTAYCAVCNMVSPAFMTGSLCVLTGSRAVILPVAAGHYIASLLWLVAVSLRYKMKKTAYVPCTVKFTSALSEAVTDGFIQSVKICGVIVFFTVITALIAQAAVLFHVNLSSPVFIFCLSLVEMTNGTACIAAAASHFPLLCAAVCFCISFGGVCIMMQTMSVCDAEPKKYLLYKAGVGLTAGVIAYIVSILVPQSVSAMSQTQETLSIASNGALSVGIAALSSCIACGCVWVTFAWRGRAHKPGEDVISHGKV